MKIRETDFGQIKVSCPSHADHFSDRVGLDGTAAGNAQAYLITNPGRGRSVLDVLPELAP